MAFMGLDFRYYWFRGLVVTNSMSMRPYSAVSLSATIQLREWTYSPADVQFSVETQSSSIKIFLTTLNNCCLSRTDRFSERRSGTTRHSLAKTVATAMPEMHHHIV